MSLLAWWYRGRQFLVKGGGKGYVEGGRRREFGGSNPPTHRPTYQRTRLPRRPPRAS